MSAMVRLVSPAARVIAREGRAAPRVTSFDGRGIALMDNMKSNADVLLERIASNLRGAHHDLETKRFRKPITSGLPFDAAVLDTVQQHFDAAIAAMGD